MIPLRHYACLRRLVPSFPLRARRCRGGAEGQSVHMNIVPLFIEGAWRTASLCTYVRTDPIGIPAYPSGLGNVIPKAIEFSDSSGNGFVDAPADVWALRCDGLPEFVYEWEGVSLWANTYTGHTSIRYYPEDHNNRPDCSIDADRELSPRAQWGGFANGNTTLLFIQNYQPGLPP